MRFLFFSYIISYYFAAPYVVLTMVISVLLADFRFFIDFSDYIDSIMDEDDEDYS